jgi:hypothetical protein
LIAQCVKRIRKCLLKRMQTLNKVYSLDADLEKCLLIR